MYDLLRDRMQVRPIEKWPGELTPEGSRRHSAFKAGQRQTIRLLVSELEAKRASACVLSIAMTEADFRLDGLPRANAKVSHPGVILSFNPNGRAAERLEFATDAFLDWTDNLRGVALGLEALRKVDRYGITSGGQQYAGFKALQVGEDVAFGLYSKTEALDFIARSYGGSLAAAIKATHPDTGATDAAAFGKVMRAKSLIGD